VKADEIMNILEAYELTGSLPSVAELASCSHHAVAPHVSMRERAGWCRAGWPAASGIGPILEKLDESDFGWHRSAKPGRGFGCAISQ
jgi:hypothetical protein